MYQWHSQYKKDTVFCSKFHFLTHGGSLDTFISAKVSIQRKTRPLLHKLASLLHHSVSFLRFACGACPPTGRGVVGVSRIHCAKIKTVQNSPEDCWCTFVNFCTSKSFTLYGIHLSVSYLFGMLLADKLCKYWSTGDFALKPVSTGWQPFVSKVKIFILRWVATSAISPQAAQDVDSMVCN